MGWIIQLPRQAESGVGAAPDSRGLTLFTLYVAKWQVDLLSNEYKLTCREVNSSKHKNDSLVEMSRANEKESINYF